MKVTNSTKPARGGKRAGAGRMRKESKKIRISTSLAPDVIAYLNSRTDKPKAQIIEEALREHKMKELQSEVK